MPANGNGQSGGPRAAKRVLVVEDDVDIARLLELQLTQEGFDVRVVLRGDEALNASERNNCDLVILDVMLPGLDGLEICRRLRTQARYVPIIMLTAKSAESDRVLGLELGADDYITKPFSIRELVARVRALFRRVEVLAETQLKRPNQVESDELTITIDKRRVECQGKKVNLTATEFDLLVQFATNPGRVYSRAQLLESVWGYANDAYQHTVNEHINRLRAKIEPDPRKPHFIQTVWGIGYKFRDKDE